MLELKLCKEREVEEGIEFNHFKSTSNFQQYWLECFLCHSLRQNTSIYDNLIRF